MNSLIYQCGWLIAFKMNTNQNRIAVLLQINRGIAKIIIPGHHVLQHWMFVTAPTRTVLHNSRVYIMLERNIAETNIMLAYQIQ